MTATKQTDLRRADALRNRERILDAAERMLERSASATLADIAAAAGVARSTLHRRFSNRDALLAALDDRPQDTDKGSKIDPGGAAQCKVTSAKLMSEGAAACPASTRIGKGTATATSGTTNVTVDAVIFNEKVGGKNAFLFVFLINDAFVTAFDANVKGNTISSQGLTGTIPGDLVVTKFNGTIDKHSKGRGKRKHDLITTPAVCPPGAKKWTNTGTFVFNNGNKDTGTSKSPCKPGR